MKPVSAARFSPKRWTALGIGAATLTGAAVTGCGQEAPAPAAPPPAEEQTLATALDAETPPAAEAAVAPTGEAGEGEGGEAGEGESGEGGVDIASAYSDAAVYRAALAITEAHVIAARDAYALGETSAAAEMFAHPVSEVLAEMQPVFAAQGATPIDPLLLEASGDAFSDVPVEEIAAHAEAITAALTAAAAKAPEDARPEGQLAAIVAADQIRRAAQQYQTAQGSEFYEPYLDGYGFYKAAEAEAARGRAAIEQDAPSAAVAIDEALAALAVAYPGAERPEALEASYGALLARSAAVDLALQD